MTRSEIYEDAENFLKQRKAASLLQQEQREAEIHTIIPEIFEIKEQLFTESRKIFMAISNGCNADETIKEQKKATEEAHRLIGSLLQKHGYPVDYLTVRPHCSDCNDNGYINGKQCHCLKDIIKLIAAQDMNRTAQVKLCDFSSFNLDYYDGNDRIVMEHILNKAQSFAGTFGAEAENLIMLGDTGLGKTHLSLSIAGAVIEKGYSAVYDTTMNLLKKIEREHFSRNSDDELLNTVLDVDLLVIDDLGTEFLTPFYASIIFKIIDTRLNMERSTIISTNLTLNEIESHYGKRISSRISSSYICMKFCGDDIRMQKRIAKIKEMNLKCV